jgi:hypothetical protein
MSEKLRPASLCAIPFSLLLVAATAQPAAAEPIPLVTVTSGSVVEFLNSHSTVDIEGTRGFSLHTILDSFSGSCDPCVVGESQTLNATIAVSMDGVGTFEGQTFTFDFNFGGGDLEFRTPPVVFPETTESTAQLHVPFTLVDSGPFASFVSFQRSTGFNLRVNLRGSGNATLFADVSHFADFGTLYSPSRVQFDFAAPTPEPAPFVLVGTALGLEWWRRYSARIVWSGSRAARSAGR